MLSLLSLFAAGLLFANALPHLVSGVTGRAFQTPFARPPGRGLSSSTVNVLWGFFNLAVAYVLGRVGGFAPGDNADVLAVGLGALASALFSAHHFGQFHGGRGGSNQELSERA